MNCRALLLRPAFRLSRVSTPPRVTPPSEDSSQGIDKIGRHAPISLRFRGNNADPAQRHSAPIRTWLPLLLSIGCLGAPLATEAATIWTGPRVVFTKANGADPTLAANQDRLTANVWLTRGTSQGLYNAAREASFAHNFSPADTEWATGTTANYTSLTYRDWETWARSVGNPPATVGVNAVLHLKTDNIYLDIKFLSWSERPASGDGFSYERSTPAATSPPASSAPAGAALTQFASRATLTPSKPVYGAFALVNPANLYIAVRGPSLGTLGITQNAHPHPSLGLYDQSGKLLVSSSQCTGSDAGSAAVLSYYLNGGAPLSINDACLGYVTSPLAAGVYTFRIDPDASTPLGSGEILFETIPTGPGATVIQFASRATVTPSNPVYGAFALVNPTNLYIAVRGPSLGTLGIIPNPQPHPSLGLYNQSGKLLVSSNQCTGSNPDSADVLSYYEKGGAPLNTNDACLGYVTSPLPAGVYTFRIDPDASNPSGSGEVLFETIPLH